MVKNYSPQTTTFHTKTKKETFKASSTVVSNILNFSKSLEVLELKNSKKILFTKN
jgi:hypothetical protein